MGGDGAEGSGGPETPGKTSDIETSPGFTPTDDIFSHVLPSYVATIWASSTR